MRRLASLASGLLLLAATPVGGAAATPARAEPIPPALAAQMSEIDAMLEEGNELVQADRLDDALAVVKKGLAYSEQHMGEGPYTALVLTNLGYIHAIAGRVDASEAAYKRSLAIHDRGDGGPPGFTVGMLNNLALLYANTGRAAQAEPLLVRARSICAKDLEPDDPRTAEVLKNLAMVYRKLGRAADAEALEREAGRAGPAAP